MCRQGGEIQVTDSATDLPIGIFDSGVGGLTVLRALREAMPQESFLYLGDTARVPYGTRSPETVQRYALQAAGLLERRGVKALVIACNTASAVALPAVQEEWPDRLVEGVIEPGAAAAVAASKTRRIGVIATEGTVRGGAYSRAVTALEPGADVQAQACALLVALAEEGWTEGPVVDAALARYFHGEAGEWMHGRDVLVLGCTHFPVLRDAIAAALPASVTIVDSAATTATRVAGDLAARRLSREAAEARGEVRYLVTDNLDRFHATATRFLGEAPAPGSVELVDITDH